MGYQIIKQPNGLLAVFSSYTDSWVVAEGTYDEVVEYFAEMAAEDSRTATKRILEHVVGDAPRKAYAQFALAFEEANRMHNKHHAKVFKKSKFIGFSGEVEDD